jgi:hypothetical protein
MRQGAHIDRLERDLDALFRQINPHAPGVGRPSAVVELHIFIRH